MAIMDDMLRRELRLLGAALATGERYGCFEGACDCGEFCDTLAAVEANAQGLLEQLSWERAKAAASADAWASWDQSEQCPERGCTCKRTEEHS